MASVAASESAFEIRPRRALHPTTVRVAGLGVVCAATMVAPALLLLWMPIVLGVPHIASDIRFLLLPLPRRQVVLGIVACTALVALKAAAIAGSIDLVRAEMIVVAGWLVGALAMPDGATERASSRGRRRLAVGLALIAASVIIGLPIQFAVLATFVHNLIAVVAWVVVARPGRRQLAAIGATLAGGVLMVALVGSPIARQTGGDTTGGLAIDHAAAVMFGGLPAAAGRALLLAFAFLQAVHYAIWLAWIPASRSRGPTATIASVAIGAATLVVIGAALVDATWARGTYLALATFHIYLEIVVLAVRFARRRS